MLRGSQRTHELIPASSLTTRPGYKNKRRRDGRMTITYATWVAGALGQPGKMPGPSYGLHAALCHRGAELRQIPGSVCHGCYATRDFYETWGPVLVARDRRHGRPGRGEGIHHRDWVEAIVTLTEAWFRRWHNKNPDVSPFDRARARVFRWHDSGDLQGTWHLVKIAEVARRLPDVSFWLPTREQDMVAEFLADGNEIPSNLTVRISADMVDQPPELRSELTDFPTSTVHTGDPLGLVCRALEKRSNKCGNCRACWDARVPVVSYPGH